MRILMTGGTGQLGRPLATNLSEQGHEVIILSRSPEKKKGLLPTEVRLERWDARTTEGWGHLADGANVIINFVGESLAGTSFFPQRWTEERRRIIVDSREQAGQALVAAVEAASKKPDLLLQASAIGYYGANPEGDLTEESPPGSDFQSQVVVRWEASTAPLEDMGVRRVIMRTGIVLNRTEGALPRLLLPFKLFAGGPMGNGRQWYSWIHQEDLMRAIQFLMDEETASGPFNLTAPNPLTNRELASLIGKVMRRPSFIPVPGFALRLAFGEVTTVVLDGQRVIPQGLNSLGFTFKFPEAEAALRDLLLG